MSLLDRAFAAIYDPVMQASEVRGLSRMRTELLAPLCGRVVEVGAGTGLNVPHWPPSVDHVLACEPVPEMADRLRARVTARTTDTPPIEVVLAPAEAIPADDASVDAVVCTLVLCTVPDPDTTLREIARVLRPGGTLALLEHVRGSGRVATWQRRLEPVQKVVARGCHLTRAPRDFLPRHGFTTDALVDDRMPGSMSLLEPLLRGHAILAG